MKKIKIDELVEKARLDFKKKYNLEKVEKDAKVERVKSGMDPNNATHINDISELKKLMEEYDLTEKDMYKQISSKKLGDYIIFETDNKNEKEKFLIDNLVSIFGKRYNKKINVIDKTITITILFKYKKKKDIISLILKDNNKKKKVTISEFSNSIKINKIIDGINKINTCEE